MRNELYGYARVSARDQNEARQVIALRKFGVPGENVLVEKISGKDFNRPAYLRLLKRLKGGDTLVIKSIDRLGRNYDEILDQWRHLTKEKSVFIVVLDMPLLDTRIKDMDLTSSFVADLVLQILSYVAEQERTFNRQRQAEGIAAARTRGVKFGKPPQNRPAAFDKLRDKWLQKKITSREAGHLLGISHTTFLAWVRA